MTSVPDHTRDRLFTTATSLSQVAELRDRWIDVQSHPNADYEQFLLVCRLRPEVIRPHVVMFEAPDGVSLLLARIEQSVISPKIGYLAPIRIPARVLHVLYAGMLGRIEAEPAGAFVDHLWQLLRRGHADVVEFNNLAEDSALFDAIRAVGPRLWSAQDSHWMTHWSLNVPTGPGELVRNMRPKHRNWLRRKQRELEDAFPGRASWRWMRDFTAIREMSSSLEAVASRTYQRALSAGFRDDEEHRRRLESFAGRGMLRLQVLDIDGVTRAFWLGVLYAKTFHSWATAYDPDFRDYEPGNLIFHRMVDELAREGVTHLDFGLGDAFYKRRFGDKSWRERTVRLFSPTPKGALLRTAVGLCSALDAGARRVVGASGHLDWVKTRWRHQVTRFAAGRSSKGDNGGL